LARYLAIAARARHAPALPIVAPLTRRSGVLGNDMGRHVRAQRAPQEQLVHISLNVVNPRGISIERLIEFREREEKESGHTLRDLRHRYLAGLETHVKRLTTEGGKREDARQIRREIADDMRSDLASLRSELGSAKREVLLEGDRADRARRRWVGCHLGIRTPYPDCRSHHGGRCSGRSRRHGGDSQQIRGQPKGRDAEASDGVSL